MAAVGSRPKVLVNASAVGWYGSQKQNWLHEGSPPANDFLGEVCQAWEAEARNARAAGIRTAIVRLGVVLGNGGGAYPAMALPFRLFAGGTIGLGRMWMSWVHLDDIVGILLCCLDNERAEAVYNRVFANDSFENDPDFRTLGLGYEYKFPRLEEALRDLEG